MTLIHRRLTVSVSIRSSSLSCQHWIGFCLILGDGSVTWLGISSCNRTQENKIGVDGKAYKQIIALNSVQENKICN